MISDRVVVGSIYEEIGRVSDILRPSLIVSGTHGASGMQKIFGSHVEKINNNSATPLPLTRGDKHMDKVDTIVMRLVLPRRAYRSHHLLEVWQKFRSLYSPCCAV